MFNEFNENLPGVPSHVSPAVAELSKHEHWATFFKHLDERVAESEGDAERLHKMMENKYAPPTSTKKRPSDASLVTNSPSSVGLITLISEEDGRKTTAFKVSPLDNALPKAAKKSSAEIYPSGRGSLMSYFIGRPEPVDSSKCGCC